MYSSIETNFFSGCSCYRFCTVNMVVLAAHSHDQRKCKNRKKNTLQGAWLPCKAYSWWVYLLDDVLEKHSLENTSAIDKDESMEHAQMSYFGEHLWCAKHLIKTNKFSCSCKVHLNKSSLFCWGQICTQGMIVTFNTVTSLAAQVDICIGNAYREKFIFKKCASNLKWPILCVCWIFDSK